MGLNGDTESTLKLLMSAWIIKASSVYDGCPWNPLWKSDPELRKAYWIVKLLYFQKDCRASFDQNKLSNWSIQRVSILYVYAGEDELGGHGILTSIGATLLIVQIPLNSPREKADKSSLRSLMWTSRSDHFRRSFQVIGSLPEKNTRLNPSYQNNGCITDLRLPTMQRKLLLQKERPMFSLLKTWPSGQQGPRKTSNSSPVLLKFYQHPLSLIDLLRDEHFGKARYQEWQRRSLNNL